MNTCRGCSCSGSFSWRHDFSWYSFSIIVGIWGDKTAEKFDLDDRAEDIYAHKFDHRRRPDYTSNIGVKQVVVQVTHLTSGMRKRRIELGQLGVLTIPDEDKESKTSCLKSLLKGCMKNKKTDDWKKKARLYDVKLENMKGECIVFAICTSF
jgi:hypothetical protein